MKSERWRWWWYRHKWNRKLPSSWRVMELSPTAPRSAFSPVLIITSWSHLILTDYILLKHLCKMKHCQLQTASSQITFPPTLISLPIYLYLLELMGRMTHIRLFIRNIRIYLLLSYLRTRSHLDSSWMAFDTASLLNLSAQIKKSLQKKYTIYASRYMSVCLSFWKKPKRRCMRT